MVVSLELSVFCSWNTKHSEIPLTKLSLVNRSPCVSCGVNYRISRISSLTLVHLHINEYLPLQLLVDLGQGEERKWPFSPPLSSWSVIGLIFASHKGPIQGAPPRGWAGGREHIACGWEMEHRAGFASGDWTERTRGEHSPWLEEMDGAPGQRQACRAWATAGGDRPCWAWSANLSYLWAVKTAAPNLSFPFCYFNFTRYIG